MCRGVAEFYAEQVCHTYDKGVVKVAGALSLFREGNPTPKFCSVRPPGNITGDLTSVSRQWSLVKTG
jgi:hypothetical protein